MARRSAGIPAGHAKARVAITVLVGEDLDHIDPVHRGGTTTYDTGRPACAHHNQHRSHHDHDPPRHDRWKPRPSAAA